MNNHSFETAQVYEYAIVIQPHEDLEERIKQLRREFNVLFRVEKPVISVHIPLVYFTQHITMQDKITRRLRMFTMRSKPFRIGLKDFSSLPTHTIYIAGSEKNQYREFVHALKTESQGLLKMDEQHKPNFIPDPNIPVAVKLLPWQYENGWLQYSNAGFNASFIADNIILLRRKEGELKYFPVQRFNLMNIAAASVQTSLL